MWLKEARAKKRKGRKKKRYLRLRLIKQNGTRDWRILLMLRLQKKKGGGGSARLATRKPKKKRGYFRVNLLSARQQMQDEELSFSYCLVFWWQEEHL